MVIVCFCRRQNSQLSVEEFHAKLQQATNFPLRPFVIPFLKVLFTRLCSSCENSTFTFIRGLCLVYSRFAGLFVVSVCWISQQGIVNFFFEIFEVAGILSEKDWRYWDDMIESRSENLFSLSLTLQRCYALVCTCDRINVRTADVSIHGERWRRMVLVWRIVVARWSR